MDFADLQSSARLTLDDGTVVTACDRCRETKARAGKVPPCETCRVDLAEENEDAARIYMMVRGQTLCRWNGEEDIPVDLDFNAVFGTMDRYPGGIKDQWDCLEKVRRLFYAMRERA